METLTPVVVEPILSEVGESLKKLTKRHVRYLFCLKAIVEDLLKEYENLTCVHDRLQQDVERAEDNAEVIEKDVEKWLKNVSEVMKDVEELKKEIEGNKTCFGGWCPNWGWRYRLSRKSEQKKCIILNLLRSGNFDRVSHPATLPVTEFLAPEDFELFKSTKVAFDQIIQALENEKFNRVGLNALGGAGKTTLAKAVSKKVKEMGMFDEVVMVVVSQTPNFQAIQDNLADKLGLELKKKSDEGRAMQLYLRFTETKKNILIVLDDVWKKFDLRSELGIPSADDPKGCKILLTTRRAQVCIDMGCQSRIPLDTLNNNEGLALLRKSSGTDDDSIRLKGIDDVSIKLINDLAIEVAEECKGLPLAIVTIGSALKEKDIDEWKVISKKLKDSKFEEIYNVFDVDKHIYAILKVSFDYLKSEETKLCFLLCSLFPEDYEITVEDLVRFAIGLALFPDANSIEEVRSQLRVMINLLKDSCLLLDVGDEEESVKMHDMVRDVGLWIASKGKNVFVSKTGMSLNEWSKEKQWEKYTAIYSMDNEIEELSIRLDCPKLEILLLGGKYFKKIKFPYQFFEEMKALRVLNLSSVDLSLKSLQFLTNLKTLELIRCNLIDISFLTQLHGLEILSLRGSCFNELPRELKELKKLRVLDLLHCKYGNRIPFSEISSFFQLEELHAGDCFEKWEVEEASAKRSNASLSEPISLSNLIVLSLRINVKCLPKDFDHVWHKLLRYDIGINTYTARRSKNSFRIRDIEAASLIAFKALYQTVEYLFLEDITGCQNIIPSIDQGGLNKLKSLEVNNCESLEYMLIIEKGDDDKGEEISSTSDHETIVFKSLAELKLVKLPQLRCIWKGPTHHLKLQSLTTMKVSECRSLTYLFSFSIAQSFVQLKSLDVYDCESLEYMLITEKGDDDKGEEISSTSDHETVVFKSLAELKLVKLPQLRCIWKGPTHHLKLQSLTTMKVSECRSLTYLFSFSIAQSLVQLKSLDVYDCESLEYMLITEKGDDDKGEEISSTSDHETVVFKSLAELKLVKLPQLRCIWKRPTHHLKLQSLTTMKVSEYRSLTYLFSFSIAQSLVQLKSLDVYDCESLEYMLITEKGDDDKGEEISSTSDHETVVFKSLAELKLVNLPQLRCIWKGPTHHLKLQSLTTMKVSECRSLTYLFSLSIAQSLVQLESLEVKECESLEHLIMIEEGDNDKSAETVITGEGKDMALINLPKLKKLHLSGLTNLIRFCPEFYISTWPALEVLIIHQCSNLSASSIAEIVDKVQLKSLKVYNCESLEHMFMIEKGDDDKREEISSTSNNERVMLSREELTLIMLPQLRYIWKGATHHVNLQSLTTMKVSECRSLTYLFSFSIAQSLVQLKSLDVYDCESLEYMLITEKGDDDKGEEISSTSDHETVVFKSLAELKLVKLPQLRCIWKEPTHHVNLQSLTTMEVSECRSLTYLFSFSIAQSLVQLKSLDVYDCESLEYMLITEKGDDDKGEEISSTSNHETVVFKSLAELKLVKLPQLRCIWKGPTHHLKLQSLATMKVSECRSLTYLFSFSIAQSLVQLKSLDVYDCESLEYMLITEKGDDDKGEEISSTSDHETVVFKSLAELKLVNLPQLRCIWKEPTHHVNLQSLTTMEVSKCRSLTYLFSLSIAQSLVQLKSLEVKECESLEHLIMIEEGDNDKSAETVITGEGKDMALINLPKLKKLRLSRLTNLIRFCPEFYISTWQALEELIIDQCSNLSASYIAEIVDEVQRLRSLTIGSCNHLYEIVVSRLKDGIFNNLEELCIKDYGVKVLFDLEGLCKTPTQLLSLLNLTTLEIRNCNRLRNIFSPSLAQNLLQLQFLRIIDCAALEEIVVEDHEEDYSRLFQNLLQIEVERCPKLRQVFPIFKNCLQKLNLNDNSELEEVFGDKEIVLPQLRWLSLQKLPGLTNFCPVGYHFIFPSSNVLVVKECPKMNTRLTLGQDKSVHAEAKALQTVKEDGSAEFPSQPSLEIVCYSARAIQESLPPYIENDEQSITQQKGEDNMET